MVLNSNSIFPVNRILAVVVANLYGAISGSAEAQRAAMLANIVMAAAQTYAQSADGNTKEASRCQGVF